MLRDRQKRLSRNKPKATVVGSPAEEIPLHKSSLKAHARILCAVAMAKYGLVDNATVARVAKVIVQDGDLQGMCFDIRVVRNLLRLGLRNREGER